MVNDKPFILIIDDDADLRLCTCQLLELAGFEVATAGNGIEALDMLAGRCRPDAILVDLVMPEMDGWGFLKALRALPDTAVCDVPVTVWSSLGDQPQARDLERLFACHVLTKPAPPQALLASLSH